MDKMSIEDMRKCLRLYGIKSDTLSNEMVEAKLSEQIEAAPDKFIMKWVENPNKEITFVIEEAIAKNIIRKNRTQYFFGTDLIGNGIDDVIAYLNNKKNQDIKLAIMGEIKSK
nr:MAG TPA: RECA-STRANDED DNA BINDING DOMAIN, RIKEN [Caudoviricetes sp.]